MRKLSGDREGCRDGCFLFPGQRSLGRHTEGLGTEATLCRSFWGDGARERELGQLCELLNTHELAIKCGNRRQEGW